MVPYVSGAKEKFWKVRRPPPVEAGHNLNYAHQVIAGSRGAVASVSLNDARFILGVTG